jgi:hypothetical protein
MTSLHAQSMRNAAMNTVTAITSLTSLSSPRRQASTLGGINASADSMVDLGVSAIPDISAVEMTQGSQSGHAATRYLQLNGRLSSPPVPANLVQGSNSVTTVGSTGSAQFSSFSTLSRKSLRPSIPGNIPKSGSLNRSSVAASNLDVSATKPAISTISRGADFTDQGRSQGYFESFEDPFGSLSRSSFEGPAGTDGFERICGDACMLHTLGVSGTRDTSGTQGAALFTGRTSQSGSRRSSKVLPSRLESAYGRFSGEPLTTGSRLRDRPKRANELEPGSLKMP